MTTLDNSATTAFAVFSCNLAGETLHAVFGSEDDALREAISCNQEDDECDYRVAPVTFTPGGQKRKSTLNMENMTSNKSLEDVSALINTLLAEHYYGWEWPDAREEATPGREEALNGLLLYISFLEEAYGLKSDVSKGDLPF